MNGYLLYEIYKFFNKKIKECFPVLYSCHVKQSLRIVPPPYPPLDEREESIRALTPFLCTMEGVNCSMFAGDYLYSMMGYVNNL
jgi:hypothetical protein